jgi:hypothetical protein
MNMVAGTNQWVTVVKYGLLFATLWKPLKWVFRNELIEKGRPFFQSSRQASRYLFLAPCHRSPQSYDSLHHVCVLDNTCSTQVSIQSVQYARSRQPLLVWAWWLCVTYRLGWAPGQGNGRWGATNHSHIILHSTMQG